MVEPYNGDLPYIFISYSHKDTRFITCVIDALQRKGYRIWYDEGIEVGTEWPQSIATRIKNCSIFLAFISNNSLSSQNCTREINYAIKHKKDPIAIYLENVRLSDGMDMQLSSIQSMYFERFNSLDSFIHELASTPLLSPCLQYNHSKQINGNYHAGSSSSNTYYQLQSTPTDIHNQSSSASKSTTVDSDSLKSKIEGLDYIPGVAIASVIITLLIGAAYGILHFLIIKDINILNAESESNNVFFVWFDRYWVDILLGTLFLIASYFTICYIDTDEIKQVIFGAQFLIPIALSLFILPLSIVDFNSAIDLPSILKTVFEWFSIVLVSGLRLSIPALFGTIVCLIAIA